MLDQIVNLVIRPPRATYTPEVDLLGPYFTLKGREFRRVDFQLVNKRGHFLECSHYRPAPGEPSAEQAQPCVIYCHGNSGCRADANDAVLVLLPLNITVLALDFSGSGLSQGDHVTLGKFEVEDLEAAIDYLRSEGLCNKVGLWGRSMGAVTALMYASKDPSVAGIVLDSPFSTLNTLVLELVDFYKIPLPRFSVKMGVLPLMRRAIRQKASFDINDLDALALAPSTFIPALFAHAKGDAFVQPHHSAHIAEAYAGDKNRITFGGDHNSPRPEFFFDSVSIFFHNVLDPPPVLHRSQPRHSSVPTSRQDAQRRWRAQFLGDASAPPAANRRPEHGPEGDAARESDPRDAAEPGAHTISVEELAEALSQLEPNGAGLLPSADRTEEFREGEELDDEDEDLARAIEMSLRDTPASSSSSIPKQPEGQEPTS